MRRSRHPNGTDVVATIASLGVLIILATVIAMLVHLAGYDPGTSCRKAGGTWTSGWIGGHYSQFCSYPPNRDH